MFAREVEAAQKVSPFCTAQVLDYDLQGRPPYIISEYIDGPPLYDVVLQEGSFRGAALERLAIGTATALAAIHEAGIVHRDFKPNNVLLASDGPRVVDFGIARSVNSDQSSVTATGMVVGTPGYLAPEQLTGEALTASVDIFAWGATMVFAATGHSPFEAETLPVIINRILNEEPDLSRLTGTMRELVAAALDKNPRRRPAAHQLLLRLLGQVGATPGPMADREDLLDKGTQIAAEAAAAAADRRAAPAGDAGADDASGSGDAEPADDDAGPADAAAWQQQTQPPRPRPQPPPRYAPPQPQRKSSNAPLFVGLGCFVALMLVVGLPIALAAGFLHKTKANLPTVPRYTPSHFGVPEAYDGIWNGRGADVGGSAKGKPFDIKITLTDGA